MGVCQQSRHSTGYGHTAFAAWAMLTLTIGCSDSPENAVEVTPVARRQPASLTAPLTPVDIRICLNVAAEMPEGKLPEFVPVGQSIIDDRMSAKQLIEAYRTEYRRMFDPVEQRDTGEVMSNSFRSSRNKGQLRKNSHPCYHGSGAGLQLTR